MDNHWHSHSSSPDIHPHEHDSHEHDGHDHHSEKHIHAGHVHGGGSEAKSSFTQALLRYTEAFPFLQSVLSEKDSRRIFYFMSLNFTFMIVQAFYGYVTDSLGLLSDSIHMFFDCLALAFGLFAAVASKWPPSRRFPYGFGKIETLSGFGNGIFLILISIEIVAEAAERLLEGRETKRLGELFVVSCLGLAVNLVGMLCFGAHHHHGHSHGHDHGHNHSHSHGHDDHDHDSTTTLHSHNSPLAAAVPESHHSHSHDNENMRGIYLHVAADTMGSIAVIISTALIHFVGWSGFDPLGSCVIAVLIFASSLPLVSSCAKKLLLTVPADTEYQLRNTLADVSGLRGVASYCVPKFWLTEATTDGGEDRILGVIHIIATRGSDLDDVRDRARALFASHGMDAVVQVEREGDGKCWCGGDAARTPSSSRYS